MSLSGSLIKMLPTRWDYKNRNKSKTHNIFDKIIWDIDKLISSTKIILEWVEIRNVDSLNDRLLISDIVNVFKGSNWLKEWIDHKNSHVFESISLVSWNHDFTHTKDYGFFFDEFWWDFHKNNDESKIPILIIRKWILNVWNNLIIVPRWFIPVFTDWTIEYFKKENISAKLYCIKNLWIYYLKLSKIPIFDIEIKYMRYWDPNYDWIFFNTKKNNKNKKDVDNLLLASMISSVEIPPEIMDFLMSIKWKPLDEILILLKDYLRKEFMYSYYYWDTVPNYRKFSNYISGIAYTKVWDCKNVNSLFIALLRFLWIKSQGNMGYCAKGSVWEFEWHFTTEVNVDWKLKLVDATPSLLYDHDEFHGSCDIDEKNGDDPIVDIDNPSTNHKEDKTIYIGKLDTNNENIFNNIYLNIRNLLYRFHIRKINYIYDEIISWLGHSTNLYLRNYYDYLLLLPKPSECINYFSFWQYYIYLKNHVARIKEIKKFLSDDRSCNLIVLWDYINQFFENINTIKKISNLYWIEINYYYFVKAIFSTIKNWVPRNSYSILFKTFEKLWVWRKELVLYFWEKLDGLVKIFQPLLDRVVNSNDENKFLQDECFIPFDLSIISKWSSNNIDVINKIEINLNIWKINFQKSRLLKILKKHLKHFLVYYGENMTFNQNELIEMLKQIIKKIESRSFIYLNHDLVSKFISEESIFNFKLDSDLPMPLFELVLIIKAIKWLRIDISKTKSLNNNWWSLIDLIVSKSADLNIYCQNFWINLFLEKIIILMSWELLPVEAYHECLSDSEFVKDPENLLLIYNNISILISTLDKSVNIGWYIDLRDDLENMICDLYKLNPKIMMRISEIKESINWTDNL